MSSDVTHIHLTASGRSNMQRRPDEVPDGLIRTARERQWADKLQSSDEIEARSALGYVMHAYADRLVRFAYGFVESADIAEDIVQDVFVRLWERRTTIRPEESLRSYLFTSVRHAALNVIKHRTVEARYASLMGSDDAHTSTVEEHLDAEVVRQQVQQGMAQLSERRRTALRLRYEEQLSFNAVAEVMGLSEKAAKHLVARALDDLRRHIRL